MVQSLRQVVYQLTRKTKVRVRKTLSNNSVMLTCVIVAMLILSSHSYDKVSLILNMRLNAWF
uniref:Uncharacterized protein n=1 Tax=Rhizophora mucronata TaxID=61149 RepID=A0A2P2MY06_RHIMU